MYIKCWGTRGSLPRATSDAALRDLLGGLIQRARGQQITCLDAFAQAIQDGALTAPLTHGGNTTCTEVGHDAQRCYVDMGSGLREAGDEAIAQGQTEHHILLTHLHWDHLIGIPLFAPVFLPGHRIHVHHVHEQAPESVQLCFNDVNFPLCWDRLAAVFEFHRHRPYEPFELGGMRVAAFELDHPDRAFGYRFEAAGRALAIGVDTECVRFTPEELGPDLPYYQHLDLLLFDGQYEPEEMAQRRAWGHSTPRRGVDLALREHIRSVLFAHHAPSSDDAKLHRMAADAEAYLKDRLPAFADHWADQPEGPHVRMAYDGLRVEVG